MAFELRDLRVDLITRRMTATLAEGDGEHCHVIVALPLPSAEEQPGQPLKDLARARVRKALEDAPLVLWGAGVGYIPFGMDEIDRWRERADELQALRLKVALLEVDVRNKPGYRIVALVGAAAVWVSFCTHMALTWCSRDGGVTLPGFGGINSGAPTAAGVN